MNCGFCGTHVNEGYTTCPACGATYERKFSIRFLRFLGGAFALLGLDVLFFGYGPARTIAPYVVLAGLGIAILAHRRIKKRPYQWYRRVP
jgi:hypothetical protein